jgi:UrcA family protein
MGTYRVSITAGIMGFMLLGGAATQIAAAAVADKEVVVRFGDLDLATTAGAEKLYARIESAAQQVCPQVDPVELQGHQIAMRCVDVVTAHAVSTISSPQLAAVYAQRAHHGLHSSV